jgi:hypothetical protein
LFHFGLEISRVNTLRTTLAMTQCILFIAEPGSRFLEPY